MSKLKKAILSPAGHRREIISTLQKLGRRHDLQSAFRDWVEMFAIALSNRVDLRQYDLREARYMQIVKTYDKDELQQFCNLTGHIIMLLEIEAEDQFSKIFGELQISNKHMGQFFTPWHVCYLSAKLNVDSSLKEKVAESGFVTMQEPCCGAGGMVLAFAQACQDEGVNPATDIHCTAVDIDAQCVHMTYIQASLFGIPAIIHRGNIIRMEFSEVWYTPAHILFGWNSKLRARHIDERDKSWWRAYTTAQRIDFCVKHGIDLETALDNVASEEVRTAREKNQLETA